MCKITMQMVTPSGFPITISFSDGEDEKKQLWSLLAMAEAAGNHYASNGWTPPAEAEPAEDGPHFAGYPCSPAVDPNGFPEWIRLPDGSLAHHRSKQGDHWYSHKDDAGEYQPAVLRVSNGYRIQPQQPAQVPPQPPQQPWPTPQPPQQWPAEAPPAYTTPAP